MYENGKMRPVESVPGIGEGRVKENDGGEWIQLWNIVRNLANVTMYPQYNNNNNKRKSKIF
jgi:hypothetical protein